MPYIGNTIRAADDYRLIDDISSGFNGSETSFALQVAGSAPVPFPKSPQQVLISVNGVIQEPDPTGASGFNLVGTNIVFSSAPTNGHAFFGIIYATADYLNAGGNFPSGSLGAPSITFIGDENSGLYRKGSGSVGFVSDATEIANFDSNGITISSGNIIIPDSIIHNGDSDTKIRFSDNNEFSVETGGTQRLKLTDAIAIFNDGGADVDFKVEGDTDTALFYVEAANDRIGIGTATPSVKTQISVSDTTAYSASTISANQFQLSITNTGAAGVAGILFATEPSSGNGGHCGIRALSTGNGDSALTISTRGSSTSAERLRIDSSGQVLVGTTSTTSGDGVITGIKAANTSRIIVGNSNTTASGVASYDMLPSNKVTGARIECRATEDFSTVANRTADLGFYTRKDGTLAEKLTILSGGNVGIGTTSPLNLLNLDVDTEANLGSGSDGIRITSGSQMTQLVRLGDSYSNNSVTGPATLLFSKDKLSIRCDNANPITFHTGSVGNVNERMRIDSSGNVGIGTTSPDNVLDLGSSSAGRALTFASYSNLFSEHSSGAFWIASNFVGNAGSSGYKTGATGNFGAAGIKVNATGGSSNSGIIQFFTDDNASKTAGDAITPTERLRIDQDGVLQVVGGNIAYGALSTNFGKHTVVKGPGFLGPGSSVSITVGIAYAAGRGIAHAYRTSDATKQKSAIFDVQARGTSNMNRSNEDTITQNSGVNFSITDVAQGFQITNNESFTISYSLMIDIVGNIPLP